MGTEEANCSKCGQRTPRQLGAEEFLLLGLVVVCLAAGVTLATAFRPPPSLPAVLLAVGISTLIYTFLGGISPKTTVFIKTVRISGTLAALLVLYMVFNGHLEKQQHIAGAFRLEEVEGSWEQAFPEGGWRGQYTMFRDPKLPRDMLRVSGQLKQVLSDKAVPLLLVMDGSTAQVTKDGLALNLKLRGEQGGPWKGKTLTWETVAPLTRKRGTVGELYVHMLEPGRPSSEVQQWGIALMKVD